MQIEHDAPAASLRLTRADAPTDTRAAEARPPPPPPRRRVQQPSRWISTAGQQAPSASNIAVGSAGRGPGVAEPGMGYSRGAAARIADKVWRGVRLSVSITSSSTAPLRLACARAKASGKSAVRVTRSAWAP